MIKYLDEKLTEYQASDIYPFHMPGHKRRALSFPNPYSIDITEIDGFDNLHHSEGILKEAQQRAADLYGARRTFYLVNGSTCGILAAICAATGKHDGVLVARNCHKSVYHALLLRELRADYLYPVLTENQLQGQIVPAEAEEALNRNPDLSAMIVTSPTYEGVVSDISALAQIAHAHGIPLIVDEAHGAHFGFGAGFPENAVKCGADAVIMSLHKTLPSFTQTALLHLCSDRISEERVQEFLGIFETSSPSYLLMAGMDSCIRTIKEDGMELFLSYRRLLDEFYRSTADLEQLHVMNRRDLSGREAFDWDDSKIVIFTGETHLTGEQLHRILLEQYRLQMEMASTHYVLAMTGVMDSAEGFERLSRALHEIDRDFRTAERTTEKKCDHEAQIHAIMNTKPVFINKFPAKAENLHMRKKTRNNYDIMSESEKNACLVKMPLYEAKEAGYTEAALEEAVGKISADMISVYPPGIPLIVPGELITENLIQQIRACLQAELFVEGNANISCGRIRIVSF